MSNNENNVKTSHSSHHARSYSSSCRKRHYHHYSKGSKYYKTSYSKDLSSEMERRGENVIYDNVRKEKINLMFKRSIFCLLAIALFIYIVYSLTHQSETYSDFKLFNKGISIEEANELNNKIIKYEFYIEELEERLSQYEEVDGMFIESKKQES